MKNNLKIATLILATVALSACGGNDNKPKAGLITLHDDTSTYDKNFIDAFKAACKKMGYTPVIKTGIDENTAAYDAAVNLADSGCKFVFADSFGHEEHIAKAAGEFKDVEFGHATGTTAHTLKLANFHNAFASIYEGRYLAGVAAGLKLKAMPAGTSHKIGYVGAYPYAEVISGFTSYYLGVKSIVEDVTMDVTFTGEWYHETKEKSAAQALIAGGCSIISQHADSMGAPNACEEAKVPDITYNGSTEKACPETYVISSKINWEIYFEYALGKINEGKAIATDWCEGLGSELDNGAVALGTPGKKAAAEGTEAKLKEVAASLRSGS
ncbi:MAG: BMP family ABC transporter substrate-binding protein, partial [Candidatus Enteromonas sp.]|nr:BMP family ABC transporter substrate-binding protein [Candidatus Enteromonas sp.]